MKQNLIITLISLLAFALNLNSQDIQATHELSTNQQGTKNYQAVDYIKLLPGFSYSASSNSDEFWGRLVADTLDVVAPITAEAWPWYLNGGQEAFDTHHGKFSGKMDITDIGTMSYTIPIELPDGMAGLKPELAINYTGMANQGNIAEGWSLSGMSSIKRIKRDHYNGGGAKDIQWDNTDLFALNGSTLYYPSDTAYDDTDTLRMHIIKDNRKIKVFSHAWDSLGPGWFEVIHGDGSREVFGGCQNSKEIFFEESKVEAIYDDVLGSYTYYEVKSTKKPVYAWHMSYKEDKYGNKIEYQYKNIPTNDDPYAHTYGNTYYPFDSYFERTLLEDNMDDNDTTFMRLHKYLSAGFYLDKIFYGGEAGDSAEQVVNLFWSTHSDPDDPINNRMQYFKYISSDRYYNGHNYQIDSIEINHLNHTFAGYLFDVENAYRRKLVSIYKQGTDYNLYPPIEFEYTSAGLSNASIITTTSTATWGLQSNNDEREDITTYANGFSNESLYFFQLGSSEFMEVPADQDEAMEQDGSNSWKSEFNDKFDGTCDEEITTIHEVVTSLPLDFTHEYDGSEFVGIVRSYDRYHVITEDNNTTIETTFTPLSSFKYTALVYRTNDNPSFIEEIELGSGYFNIKASVKTAGEQAYIEYNFKDYCKICDDEGLGSTVETGELYPCYVGVNTSLNVLSTYTDIDGDGKDDSIKVTRYGALGYVEAQVLLGSSSQWQTQNILDDNFCTTNGIDKSSEFNLYPTIAILDNNWELVICNYNFNYDCSTNSLVPHSARSIKTPLFPESELLNVDLNGDRKEDEIKLTNYPDLGFVNARVLLNGENEWITQNILDDDFCAANMLYKVDGLFAVPVNHTPDDNMELKICGYIFDFDMNTSVLIPLVHDWSNADSEGVLSADFNGDGLTDYYDDGSMILANGRGFDSFNTGTILTKDEITEYKNLVSYDWDNVQQKQVPTYETIEIKHSNQFYTRDVNADGMTDVVSCHPRNGTIKIYLSTGTSFKYSHVFTNSEYSLISNYGSPFAANNDEDNFSTTFAIMGCSIDVVTVHMGKATLSADLFDRISKISEGKIQEYGIDYLVNLDINTGKMRPKNRNSDGTYAKARTLLGQVSKISAFDHEFIVDYGQQLKLMRGKKEFLGFDTLKIDKKVGDIHTVTTKLFIPMEKQSNMVGNTAKLGFQHVFVVDSSGIDPVYDNKSCALFEYDTLTVQYGTETVQHFDKLVRKVEYDCLNEKTIAETYEYDNFFSPTKKSVYTFDSFNFPNWERVQHPTWASQFWYSFITDIELSTFAKKLEESTTYEYYDTSNEWIPGRPTQKVVKQTLASIGSHSDTILYEYSTNGATKYLDIVDEVKYKGTVNETHKKITPDSHGNPATEQLSFPNDTSILLANRTLTTTRTFSSNGARMLTETNPMGFTSAYSYNDETGLLHSVTDPNGLITVSNYDFMGRKTGETLPDGNMIEKSSGWSEGQTDAPNDTTIFYTYEAQTGKTTTYTYFNNKNQKVRDVTFGLKNDKKYTDYVYDQNGRLIKEYQPYFADSTRSENRCTNHQYDIHGRVVKSMLPDGTFLKKSYNGRIDSTFTGITKAGVEHILRTTVTKKNAYDLPEYEIDSEEDKVVFNYDPRGNLIETYVEGQASATRNVYGYNRMGIRNMMKNNASDTAYAEFNTMGKILWLKDPIGNEIDYEYDKLGRNTEHSIKPGGIPTSVGILTVQYAYDEQKKGMLSSISGDGHTQAFSYDDHCRIANTTETYPGLDEVYTKDYGFDKFGRQNLETFSDYGVSIENKYHAESGALIEVGTNINGTFSSAWKATADDELGNITDWNTGNNTIPVNKTVELESGNITEIDYGYGTGSLYNIEYDYYDDRNFKKRKHTFGSTTQTEYYAFDKMKQLIYSGPSLTTAEHVNWDETEFTDTTSQTIRYDDFGQKTYIDGICATGTIIDYDDDGHIANPDALTTENPLFRKQQNIRYNSRNRVESFQLDDDSLTFSYRPDTTKWETKYYENGTLKYTKYHFGNHEKFVYPNGTTKNLFYIFGGKELTGLYIKENSTGQMGYVISDHLGSVWALANDQGGFIEQYAYDPWGRRMDPTDWSTPDTTRTEFKTDRGFTLHEHYDHMQIVNMNARMYDPLLGVFTGVDPLADKYPGWGGYVYCLNKCIS